MDHPFKMDFISRSPQVETRVASQMMECQETSSCSTEVVPNAPQARKAKKSLGSFFKQSETVAKGDSSLTLKDIAEAKLNTYMLSPSIAKEKDQFAWWKAHKISLR